MKRLNILFLLCLLSGGCAFTRADLNVSYGLEKAEKGPLSSVAPLKVRINELADQRKDKLVIGHKINGLGMDTADIVTKKPVPEIMRSALISLFEKNGHHVNGSGGQFVIDGEIKQFWLELQMNLMTIEFMGTATLSLNVKDAGQKVLYTREYQGHYNQKKAAGYVKSWEKVMNITLEKLIYQIATDAELMKVLNGQSSKIEQLDQKEAVKP